MVTYHFDSEHAQRWGLPEAVLLHNLIFWLRKNKAEGRHFHDGRYWTYNTVKGLARLFPFWSEHQVRRYLDSLRDQGVILSGNYDPDKFKRALWLAVADESLLMLPDPETPGQAGQADQAAPGDQGGDQPDLAGSPPPFGRSAKSNRRNRQNDAAIPPPPSGDPARSLIGTDTNRSYSNRSSTLNVGERDMDNGSGGGDAVTEAALSAAAVAEVVALTGDEKSERRFEQLYDLCVGYRLTGQWQAALLALRRRLADVSQPPLERPGAYFNATLGALLRKHGVNVPAGSPEEREGVRELLAGRFGTAQTPQETSNA
jgi:hypothetical protein